MTGPSAPRTAARHNSPNLDILRAIAVLTVVLDHLMPTLVFHSHHTRGWFDVWTMHVGHAGVLAFFVHTSLVLMYSLERIGARTPLGLLGRFYVRRAFRIYPLAMACVIAIVALGWPEGSWRPFWSHRVPTTQEIIANLLLVQNLWGGHSVLTPLWSLPYEVEMYLVLPFAFWIARRRDGLLWIVGLLIGASVGGYLLHKLITHGHMNLAAYVPCFLAGVMCYVLRDRWTPRISGRLWWLFVLAIVIAYCGFHTESDRLIYWYGWVYCIVLALAIPWFHDSPITWLNRACEVVARYSYGVYLLHAPALYVVFGLWSPGSLVLALVAFVALTAGLSVAAYHLLEEPMVRLGRKLSSGDPRRSEAAATSTTG